MIGVWNELGSLPCFILSHRSDFDNMIDGREIFDDGHYLSFLYGSMLIAISKSAV
jgi:hypothetical protein